MDEITPTTSHTEHDGEQTSVLHNNHHEGSDYRESSLSSLTLSPLTESLIAAVEKKEVHESERRISVNPVVSKFASWYERLRNAMEYREEEVVLRATIERILKRRLLLGGNAKTTAAPLLRELIWARYLLDDTVGESMIAKVEKVIDLYLRLRLAILAQHSIADGIINQWTYDLMSSHIEQVVKPHKEEDIIAGFMFQLLKENVQMPDESEETRGAQVYLAIRKAFARDDQAFLRFHMFNQIFGILSSGNIDHIATNFPKGFLEINKQLEYPRKDAIYSYIKKQTAAFLIFEDVIHQHHGKVKAALENKTALQEAVTTACQLRYTNISAKVKRAIIRSVLFILISKVIFAFLIEGTYERLIYGHIIWTSIALNTGTAPLLMVFVGFLIRTPDQHNTQRIYTYIETMVTENHPRLGQTLRISVKEEVGSPLMQKAFGALWGLAFLLSFGGIIYVLTQLSFNFVSQGVFIFFLAIVSFLAYRISLTAGMYLLGEKQGLLTPVIDFLFVPIIRVGRQLTEGISQINFVIFIFDFLIETPFKELFAFFEQLFHFLHTKRDELG